MNTRFLGLIALLFSASSFLSGCFLDDFPCATADNTQASQSISNLSAFKGLKLEIDGDVNLTQDTAMSVTVHGSQNLIDLLEIGVEDSILIIDTDQHCVLNSDLVFDISLPEIEYLVIAGSGNIVTASPILVQDIELKIAGSGDLDLELDATSIEGKIAGSGDVRLDGSAQDFKFDIAGSGNIKAFDLQTLIADLKIAGSGDMEVNVSDTLHVLINGSGSVRYKGYPSINSQVNGSGSLIDAN